MWFRYSRIIEGFPQRGGQFSEISHWKDMHIPIPLDSILEATLTVSPNKQYLGIVSPTTPAATGPTSWRKLRNLWTVILKRELYTAQYFVWNVKILLESHITHYWIWRLGQRYLSLFHGWLPAICIWLLTIVDEIIVSLIKLIVMDTLKMLQENWTQILATK